MASPSYVWEKMYMTIRIIQGKYSHTFIRVFTSASRCAIITIVIIYRDARLPLCAESAVTFI
jgi:hypothetical protein